MPGVRHPAGVQASPRRLGTDVIYVHHDPIGSIRNVPIEDTVGAMVGRL